MSEVVKVCKKHGELKESDTYLLKNSKSGNLIRLCSICKKGYRNNWSKLNPDKVKLSQIKMRNKRLEELENGTLKKICKRHGELPLSKISINARGALVCRLCGIENKNKVIQKDPDKFKKRVRDWYHSNLDRKKRYAENDKLKKRIRQKRLYQKWKKIPEKKDRMDKQAKESRDRARENLSDSYLRSLIKNFRQGGKNNLTRVYLKDVEVPPEILEIKRLAVKINREKRKRKK